jgi:hypothetical protein
VGVDRGQRLARQIGEQAHEMTGPFLPGDRQDFPTVGSAEDPGTGIECLKQAGALFRHIARRPVVH